MSLFGALDTAVSGLSAQSAAFTNISDNVANSQTTGFKETNTSFEDYLTTSTASDNESGAVVTKPEYQNDVQGTISTSSNKLALAIAGQGFFAVSEAATSTTSTSGATATTFNPEQYYTRDGNFTMNAQGYLVNDAGEYLNGWTVDPSSGAVNENSVAPIKVTQSSYDPIATQNVDLSANLPATPTNGTATGTSPLSSDVTVYDSLGTAHTVTLNWSQTSANNWTVQVGVPDNTAATDVGSADVTFGTTASGATIPAGTIGNVAADAADAGTVTTSNYAANGPAAVSFTANFGSGNQTISLNLGTYGGDSGVTQFAGTTYDLKGLTQDGVAPGSYSGVTMQTNGDVVVDYSNGQNRTIAQVPLDTFNAPDSLQKQNGQAYTATQASGTALTNAVNTNGAGTLAISSLENSNVDIATQFTQLIVAQQAYSANAKVVTTADSMMQTTISMLS